MPDLQKKIKDGAVSGKIQARSDRLVELWQEYRTLVNTLRKQGIHRDVALEMQLTVVMMDLGLYRPSPP